MTHRSPRLLPATALLLALTGALLACGSSSRSATSSSSVSSSATTTSSPATTTSLSVTSTTSFDALQHFDTPEAAMRYLAVAWNSADEVALKHVTDPDARELLDGMRQEAVNLRLDRCEPREGLGDYACYFDHDYPPGYVSMTSDGRPVQAVVLVGPADAPGWYMTRFQHCG